VIFVTRNEEILVGGDVDGAHAVSRDLRRQRLRGDDPGVFRSCHELVLDLPVLRQDAELLDVSSEHSASQPADFDDPVFEIRFEPGNESKRSRVVLAPEEGDVFAVIDQVALVGGGPASRGNEIMVRLETAIGSIAQEQLDGAIVSPSAGLSTDHVQRGLDFEGKIRRLFRTVFHFDSILETAFQVAFADPIVLLRADVVGRDPPHQRQVLVEETWMNLSLRVQ